MPSPPTLVVGASGQVGTQLLAQLGDRPAIAAGRALTPPPHLTHLPWRSLDLAHLAEDPAAAHQHLAQPLAAVLCVAGATNVDACETDPTLASVANATGPAALAAATPPGTPFVFFSTEYVFDGSPTAPGPYTEASPINPLSVYGQSKLLGEQLILAARPDALILRTTVVYGPDPARKNFLYFLHRELSAGRLIRVVTDQVSTPTCNDDLARATLALLARRTTGIVHVAGPDLLSRFDFAVEAAHRLGLPTNLVHPITTASLAQPAPRPLAAGLDTTHLRTLLPHLPMKGIADGIDAWAQHALP